MKKHRESFVEKHSFLTCFISILFLSISIIIFICADFNKLLAFPSLVCIIASVTTFLRVRIWKGNLSITTSDGLWRILALKNKEDTYQSESLKHAKIFFVIAIVAFFVDIVMFVVALLV